ncbi:Ankyrin repeat-containing protein [Zhouia amylolytica]|uniref:Ankyrin repeat-containing protein n=1 Tax=Zhouia amylolytica TaxID=376730 RepID=A0A1I6RR72_9FLAO|nr:ankyrin repeat domain-containing protein [Zhouia amylolytica]SFS67172.1 Ankyrin repeat-containing protein [Zhouia amylolytica]
MKKLALVTALLFIGVSISNAKTTKLEPTAEKTQLTVKPNVGPFCMAIVNGDVETVKKLIELGADVNQKSSNGMTPAMFAARYNRCEILQLLIAKGADLKVKDSKFGRTALKYAELSKATKAHKIIKEALRA